MQKLANQQYARQQMQAAGMTTNNANVQINRLQSGGRQRLSTSPAENDSTTMTTFQDKKLNAIHGLLSVIAFFYFASAVVGTVIVLQAADGTGGTSALAAITPANPYEYSSAFTHNSVYFVNICCRCETT